MSLMNFCTLDEVKSWANISTANNDAMLTALITNSSAFIRQYCSRLFDSMAFTETRNGPGGPKLMMKNYPISAVASVSVDGGSIPASASPTAYGFAFDNNVIYIRGGSVRTPTGGTGTAPGWFTRGFQNVTVVYTAGYVRNATPASDALPGDLRQACIDLCLLKFRRRQHPERAGESLAGQNLNYITAEVTDEIKGVLNRYKRVFPV